MRAASARVPYALGVRMQRAWARLHRCARSPRFRETLRLVREAQPASRSSRADLDTAMDVLVASHFSGWRRRVLAECTPQALSRLVRLSGLATLRQLYGRNRGVIVANSHFGAAICVPVLLERLGFRLHSMGWKGCHLPLTGGDEREGLTVLDVAQDDRITRLRALRSALGVLKHGGLLHLAGDSYSGRGGMTLPFLGRARPFAGAFAYLAVEAEVPIVPVFAALDPSGRIQVEFMEPLDGGSRPMSREGRVRLLMEQFVRLLESRWTAAPGNVLLSQWRHQASLPPAHPAGEDRAVARTPALR